jgi:diguanylate cyclase (GGDEF)-like protein
MSGKYRSVLAIALPRRRRPGPAESPHGPWPSWPPGPLQRMIQSPLVRDAGVFAGLAALYFIAGKLGLRLAFVHASASAVSPPTGIALVAFLLLGARVWPAIFAGAFLVNLTTAGSVATSIGIASGNTLEGLIGAYLVNRFAHGRQALDGAEDVFRFAVLAGIVSTTVAATLGVTSLALGGFARWADYGSIWLTWWLGDAAGDLVVAPVLLLWTTGPRVRPRPAQILEAVVLLGCLALAGGLVFGGLFPSPIKDYPLEFVCIPFVIWAALRFGAREAATTILLLSAIANRGTLHGFGPFARETPNESLLLLQAFMGVTSVTTLILAAVVAERGRVEAQLRQLSVTDPLTGLGNYRRLVTVLEAEVRRSRRTERPFALVFFDVDGLKGINDRHGHLVGSRALCRVAEVLHVSCRAVDTAARYGGDEFAVVLPETEEAAARRVAQRVVGRLAEDREQPRLAASMGVAVYPRDGATAEALIGAADRLLYEMKAHKR